jgi:hypothetical protein
VNWGGIHGILIVLYKYWFKLQNILLVRLPKQAYEMGKTRSLRQESEENIQNWIHNLKRCLDVHGFFQGLDEWRCG